MTTPPVLEPAKVPAARGRALLPVVGLVAAAVAVVLAGAAILGATPERTVTIGPTFDGRILVGLPSGEGAMAHLLRNGAEVAGSPSAVDSPCPTLLRTADGIAVRDRWTGYRFESFAGDIGSEWFRTNYHGGERWSADHSTFARVDFDNGPSVITFPDGDVERPTVTTYALSGSIEGLFSADGSRLALPVPDGRGSLAIHVLEGGVDTVGGTVPFQGRDGFVSGSWSADARSLLLLAVDRAGKQLWRIDTDTGAVHRHSAPDGLAPDANLVPLEWSPNGVYAVVGSDRGAAWILDTMRGTWLPLETSIAPWSTSLRWSADGELGVITGRRLRIHRSDGTLTRSVDLAGTFTTWSPDGTEIASITNPSVSPVGVWVTDAWGSGGSRQVATLLPRDPIDRANADMTCIQWQPEVVRTKP